ncbi:hypothetical protein GX50_02656 [[Emmonsia] crescens]|uniref:Uncharacterized protein n=1 Tax=[Emmonsia] crescens TaxID=73230 RepID=A0A2B7ZMT1_9EURO|nr:hypothetical protein GX50_02656 [Emmonsia crescens]
MAKVIVSTLNFRNLFRPWLRLLGIPAFWARVSGGARSFALPIRKLPRESNWQLTSAIFFSTQVHLRSTPYFDVDNRVELKKICPTGLDDYSSLRGPVYKREDAEVHHETSLQESSVGM